MAIYGICAMFTPSLIACGKPCVILNNDKNNSCCSANSKMLERSHTNQGRFLNMNNHETLARQGKYQCARLHLQSNPAVLQL